MTFHMNHKKGVQASLLSIECKKLLKTRLFWAALILGLAIVSLNTLYMVDFGTSMTNYAKDLFQETGELINPEIYGHTLYNTWIGNESFSFSFSLYYFLFPMLCILPYGWSLSAEMQTGYLKNIAVRVRRKDYFQAKYWSAFLGGGLAATIPLTINFIVDAMFIPAIKPDLLYSYYMTMQADFLADFYSIHPLLFNLLFFVLSFVYFGLVAGCAVSCAFLVKSRIMTILFPLGVFYVLHYLSSLVPYPDIRFDLSPLYCIHPTAVRYHSSGFVLFGYMAIMLLFAICVGIIKGNDTYEIF